jgi:predicted P-loop ATPase
MSSWPKPAGDSKILRRAIAHASDPKAKKGWIGAFCRTYDVHEAIAQFLPTIYERGVSANRYTYCEGTSANGVTIHDDFGPGSFSYSHHESDPARETLCNAFDLVRIHRFGSLDDDTPTPAHKTASFKAMIDWCSLDPRVQREAAQAIAPEFDDVLADDDSWKDGLVLDRAGQLVPNLGNVVLILKHDAIWQQCVAYNAFSGDRVITRSLPKHPLVQYGDLFTDRDVVQFKLHLEQTYRVQASHALIYDAVEIVATSNQFHPVRDFLDSLPEWDGVSRVESMLSDYLGAPLDHYTRSVSRKLLCAAINRVMNPGSKWDYLLVLEGLQGKRKSMWIEALAMGWYTSDLRGDVSNKAAVENMRGKWIVELPELESITTKRDADIVKAFLSQSVDRMRVPYARASEDFPRQCVFIGTTNRDAYLIDDTGNRRFWPVQCSIDRIDVDGFRRALPQIWAEAKLWWAVGEDLWLDDTGEQMAAAEQENRLVEPGYSAAILEWVNTPLDPMIDDVLESQVFLRDVTCALDVWTNLFGQPLGKMGPALGREINAALRRLPGWEWGRWSVPGFGRQRGIRRITTHTPSR